MSKILLRFFFKLINGVFLLLILARVWGPEPFGIFMYPFTLAAIIVILVDYGFNLQLVRDVGRNVQDAHRLTCQAVSIKTFLTAIVAIVGLPLVMVLKSLENYRLLLVLLVFSNILNSYGLLFNLSFRGMGLFDTEVKTVFWSTIVTFIIVGGLVLSGQSPEVIAMGFVLSKGFFLAFSWVVYRHLIDGAKFIYPHLSSAFTALLNGFPFAAHVALGTLYFSVDTIIIQHFLGAEGVGIYQAGLRIMLGGLILTDVFANVYLSRLAKESADRIALVDLATRMTRHFLVFGVFGFICMITFSDLVVNLIYGGDGYNRLIPLFPFFAVVLLLRYVASSYGIVLTVDDRQVVRMIAAGLSVIVSITLNFVLIPMFDLHGAIFASILTHIFLTGIYVVFTWRQVHSWLMDWRSWILILAAIMTGLFQLTIFSENDMARYTVMFGDVLCIGFIGVTLTEHHNLLSLLRKFYDYALGIFGNRGSAHNHDR